MGVVDDAAGDLAGGCHLIGDGDGATVGEVAQPGQQRDSRVIDDPLTGTERAGYVGEAGGDGVGQLDGLRYQPASVEQLEGVGHCVSWIGAGCRGALRGGGQVGCGSVYVSQMAEGAAWPVH